MFKYLLGLFLFLNINVGYSQKKNWNETDSLELQFIKHFKLLDKTSKENSKDTIYCCLSAVNFMTDKTDIESGTNANRLGYFGFTKEALKRWHKWFSVYLRKQRNAKR